MLPATPGNDIGGHFLFGAFAIGAGFCLGALSAAVSALISPSIRDGLRGLSDYPGVIMILIGLALLLTAIQQLTFCVFRFDQVQGMQLIRIIPAFVFFFGMTYISGEPKLMQAAMRLGRPLPGLTVLLACIGLYIAIAYLGSRVGERKDRS